MALDTFLFLCHFVCCLPEWKSNLFPLISSLPGRSTDEHIDKTIVKDLVSDEDALLARDAAKKEKKQRKADQKLRERLKAERKKAATGKEAAEDEDDENIVNFAKGTRKTKKW